VSTARPLFPLLSAGAALAVTVALPGTALAEPGQGEGSAGKQRNGAAQGTPHQDGPDEGRAGEGRTGKSREAPAGRADSARPSQGEPRQPARAQQGKRADKPADKPVRPAGSGDAGSTAPRSAEPAAGAENDPAGNNGTIKIDTVPADPDPANRPHPGCAFVVQFFGFDADQHADITFTGQAPTRTADPLLQLDGRLISSTPADGALEEGHSLTLTAADLGLLGTPTAAKGWHVKVAVDALEAPGGAKQKVFWLDCADGAAIVEVAPDGDAVDGAEPPSTVEPPTTDESVAGAGDDVAVQAGSASRDTTADAAGADVDGAGGEGGEGGEGGQATLVASAQQGRSMSSTLASVLPFAVPAALPFTGPAGLAAMLVAGLGAIAAGVLTVRAGRRRTSS
jgi:hypothetical protein